MIDLHTMVLHAGGLSLFEFSYFFIDKLKDFNIVNVV